LGIDLENVKLSDLGRCKKVVIDAENTTIVEGAGTKLAIQGRCEQIKREIGETDSEYDKEKLQERLAKLAGGVAQFKVGAATETEMKERKALVEDSLHATRAAIEEGIVPGGGVALLRCAPGIRKLDLASDDEKTGSEIVARAVEQPARWIAQNAGLDGGIVVNRIRQNKDKSFGYNADKEIYEDLVAAGVVDPTKVVRSALQNAASVAALLLTTESLVADIPEKEKKAEHHDDHGGGMGGMGGGMGGMGGGMGMM
jgi:chaperonin GroEL